MSELILGVLGMVFGAWCVRQTVRIVNQPVKPSAKFWVATVLAVILAYPLSIGPAIYAADRLGVESVLIVYTPIYWLASHCEPFASVLLWYAYLWGFRCC